MQNITTTADTRLMRERNDVRGLAYIDRFGWLRSVELGRLMWPNDTYSRTRADRVIRGWVSRRLVLERPLPDGAGRAVVLSSSGADFLLSAFASGNYPDMSVAADLTTPTFGGEVARIRSNKDWGYFKEKQIPEGAKESEKARLARFMPPDQWRHELLTAGVLSLIHEHGGEFLTERQIRARQLCTGKIPDGLYWYAASIDPETGENLPEEVTWLEVENARKDHKTLLEELAIVLCNVSNGRQPSIAGMQPTWAEIAFVPASTDNRGHALDHRYRVTQAIKTYAHSTTQIVWCPLKMSGRGVVAWELETETIHPNPALKIEAELRAIPWTLSWIKSGDRRVQSCSKDHRTVPIRVWQDNPREGTWLYEIEEKEKKRNGIAISKTAAIHMCSVLLHELYLTEKYAQQSLLPEQKPSLVPPVEQLIEELHLQAWKHADGNLTCVYRTIPLAIGMQGEDWYYVSKGTNHLVPSREVAIEILARLIHKRLIANDRPQ
jgi:hypothetical protein